MHVFKHIATSLCIGVALSTLGFADNAPAKETEALPDGAQLTAIQSSSTAVEIDNKFAYTQLLLTGRLAGGEQIDVTRMVEFTAPDGVAKVSPGGLVRPVADGEGQITARLAGRSIAVPVKVTGQQAAYTTSFVQDVMPALSKAGCNAGTCHGSLNGKNGFKLSLRGYDPLFDHRSLTDDVSARRINRAAPDQSLMLLKTAGVVPHVGGVLYQPGEPYYELIRSWIAGGMKLDLEVPRVKSIALQPINPVVPMSDMKQQIRVIATYANGKVRDVTQEAFVTSGNTEVADTDKTGLVTTIRRGEAPILARFEGAYAATTVTVMGDRSGYQWNNPPANNYIDELVHQKLQRVKALPSELCTDDEFLRRVTIDLTGLPPTPEQIKAFLADTRDTLTKRDEVVDRLIGSADYIEHWTNKWGDLLQVNRKFLGEQGAAALRAWIKQALASNMPYDQFVYQVLTGSGSTMQNPPAAYYKVLRTPEDTMENTTQLFLAVRFNCNKCHDHPFERWTQSQYYHLAAFFAQVGRKEDPSGNGQKIGGTDVEAPKPLIETVFDTGAGEVTHAATGKPAVPEFPYPHADLAAESASRREQLAKWTTSKDNQYFAKSYVNRLWGYHFGTGIIEPIDDIRAGNPPTNPELLDRLTQEFIASGFNTQEIVRAICKSRTYQMSIVTNQWNKDDEINFSHAIARRLPAEVLYDAIYRTTGAQSQLPGVPAGFRAAQLPDVGLTLASGFFEQFGRPARESSCECERSSGVMLGPVMALVNGPTIADAIADPNNAITRLVASESDDRKLVDELFVRILNRPASDQEVAAGLQALQGSEEEVTKAREELAAYAKQLDARQVEWEAGQAPPVWHVLEVVETQSSAGATFAKQPDGSVLVGGTNAQGQYTISATTDLTGITGIRLEALTDPSLPSQGPGRAPNGNFVVNELTVTAAPKADPASASPVTLQNASADYSQQGYSVINLVDSNPGTGWAVDPQGGRPHVAVLETKQSIEIAGGTLLKFVFEQQYPDNLHQLGKFRLSVTASKRPLKLEAPPANVAAILAVAAAQRTDAQKAELATYFRSLDPEWARLGKVTANLEGQAGNKRLVGAQDLAWALINSPAFLFNR